MSGRSAAPLVARVLAALPRDVDAVAVRDGARWLVGAKPEATLTASGPAAFDVLDRLAPAFWAGWLSYDLGRAVERVVPRAHEDLRLPDLALARFDARLVIEGERAAVEGEGRGRGGGGALLDEALTRAAEVEIAPDPALRRWHPGLDRPTFEAGVRAIVELIRAGDCYQVNFTRRLVCDEAADPVALFSALEQRNPSPHGAFVRLSGTTVVSASPERFLRRDGVRVETRPIKGTGSDPAALVRSAKDRAENVMIVDLARNDLGRVCEYGSIETPSLCKVEAHPGLHHLVSTVVGRMRPGVGAGGLIRATFPPASITGAPKPRVMQAIEDLEPVRRGIYCGALGWIDEGHHSLDLNVAIRTFTVTGGRTFLGVGGGIVADSDPRREWEETELKAARLLQAAGVGAPASVAGRAR